MRNLRLDGSVPRLTERVVALGAMAGRDQPVLEADDFALRPWVSGDASEVEAAYADAGIQQWHARSMSSDEADAWIRSWHRRWSEETAAGWAIARPAQLLGQISLREIHGEDGLARLSYWVVPAARGRGVATRALATLTRWAFEDLGLHRIELMHSTQNPVSCRVAAAVGYAWEGTKRREALHPDGWHDMHLHARLSDEAG